MTLIYDQNFFLIIYILFLCKNYVTFKNDITLIFLITLNRLPTVQ